MPFTKFKKAIEHYVNVKRAALGDSAAAISLHDNSFYKQAVDILIENWAEVLHLGTSETTPNETIQAIKNHYFQAAFHLCSLASLTSLPAKNALDEMRLISTASLSYDVANKKAQLIVSSLEPFSRLPWALENGRIQERETWMVFTRYAHSLDGNDATKLPLSKIAFHLCMAAALAGNIHAQIDLGTMYRRGLGIEVNEAEAIKWLFPVAEAGGIASLELGLVYSQQQNFKFAAHYFEQASRISTFAFISGDIELAKLYLYGLGVKQDAQQAIKLLNNAINKVDAPVEDKNLARAFLCLIQNTLPGSDVDARTLSQLGMFILLNKKVLGDSQYADAIAKQNELLGKFQQFNAQVSNSSSSSSTILNKSNPVATETDRLLPKNNSSINRPSAYSN